jgi:integrase
MAALSVRSIEAIKPRDKPFKVTIDRGLQLRVAPDGRRTLLVRYSVKGYTDERQYSLPREYGDGPGQIKLADAKAEAARIRALARDGIDWPEQNAQELQKAGEQKQLAAKKQDLTFAEALQEYAERKRRSKDGLPLKARTKADYLGMVTSGRVGRDGQRFADGELVALASLRLSDIAPQAIRRTYERCARKSARRAGYAMQVLRAVLRWHGVVIADNPLGKDTAGRDRIVLAPPKGDPSPIPPERLGAWWNAARNASSQIASGYYRFQLLTGCRGVEIHGHKKLGYPPLRVADVDLQGGRVTLRDTKNRSDHRILLSRQALAIARAHCEGRAPEEPLFPIMDARKTLRAINASAGTSVQGHGLRATFASVAEGLVSAAVLKRMMNHAVAGDVTLGHYVAKSDAQLRAGWQAVADWIEAEARNCAMPSKAPPGGLAPVAASRTHPPDDANVGDCLDGGSHRVAAATAT